MENLITFLLAFIGGALAFHLAPLLVPEYEKKHGPPSEAEDAFWSGLQWSNLHWGLVIALTGIALLLIEDAVVQGAMALLGAGLGLISLHFVPELLRGSKEEEHLEVFGASLVRTLIILAVLGLFVAILVLFS